MEEKRDGLDGVRLDESAARRLIERATELDARLKNESTVADLREAARGAGISDEAFQRALSEVREDHHPDTRQLVGLSRRHRRLKKAAAIFVAVVVAGLLVMSYVIPARIRAPTVADEAQPQVPAVPSPRLEPPGPTPSVKTVPAPSKSTTKLPPTATKK